MKTSLLAAVGLVLGTLGFPTASFGFGLVGEPMKPSATVSVVHEPARKKAAGRRYCVICGSILPKYDKLSFTLSDAQLIYERLGIGDSDRVLLVSDAPSMAQRPTKKNVLNAIRQEAAKCGPDDTFWFYWSGHGDNFNDTSFILAYDCDPCDFRTMVSVNEIHAAIAGCKARACVLILDSCHSGGVKSKKFDTKTWEDLLGNVKGQVGMAGCAIDETSLELTEISHGLFTYYLVKGMAGAAAGTHPRVTLDDLKRYVTANVAQVAKQNQSSQHPQFFYDSAQGQSEVGTPDPAAVAALPDPPAGGGGVKPMTPLNPGVALHISGAEPNQIASAATKLRGRLIRDKFPVVSDEQTKPFEDQLSASPDQAAAELPRWRSRFLLRGSLSVETNKLGEDLGGLYSAVVVFNLELIDASGQVLATFDSNTNQQAIRAADVSAASSAEKAISLAVDAIYKIAKGKMADVLQAGA